MIAGRRIIDMQIHSIGIDLGKTSFHLVALGERGKVVIRKKLSRQQLLSFTANLEPSLIGLEACSGSHFLGRVLSQQGHQVRLIPAQFVKPFVKSNKNDYLDAEAIAEAVERENMRFVPIKTEDQLDLQALHRVRDRLVSRRTAVINQVRAFLLERGITFPKGPASLRRQLPEILENGDAQLSPRMRGLLATLWQEWKHLEEQIESLSGEIESICASDPACQRLRQIPGSDRWWRPRWWPPSATVPPSARVGSSPPGWDWCPDSTRPAARPSYWASASAGTPICARCSSTGPGPRCCA
jgi:transposase